MSVRSETYIIYGAKLDFKKTSEILNKREYDNSPDITFPWCGKGAKGQIGVLSDGMNSEYALAGYCIECGSDETGISLTNITHIMYDLKNQLESIDDKINKFLRSNNLELLSRGLKSYFLFDIFVVTHYH